MKHRQIWPRAMVQDCLPHLEGEESFVKFVERRCVDCLQFGFEMGEIWDLCKT